MLSKRLSIVAVAGVVLALAGSSHASILAVDFDSLSTGVIDGGGATTAQLNGATTGGTWDLNSSATHQIQADAAGGGSTDQGFSSRASSAMWGAGVDLDSAVDISEMTSDLVITFTSGTTYSTGYTRFAHWKLFDDTTQRLDIKLDNGTVYLNGSNIGNLFGSADSQRMGATWDTSSGFLLDFEITIDSSGNVDVSVTDHGGGGSANTVTGSKTIASTSNIDRLETSWSPGSPQGIYFGEIEIVPEPATMSLLALGGLVMIRRRK